MVRQAQERASKLTSQIGNNEVGLLLVIRPHQPGKGMYVKNAYVGKQEIDNNEKTCSGDVGD
jgi:hypothetical protein